MSSRFAALLLLAALSLAGQGGFPVVIDGEKLWEVKAARAGFGPGERADDIRSNIIHVAEDQRRRLDDVREVHTDGETILLVSRIYLFSVTDEDARLEGTTRENLFAKHKKTAIDAVQRYRAARSYAVFIRSALLGLAALAAALFALTLLRIAHRRASEWVNMVLARMAHAKHLASVYRLFEGPMKLLARFSLSAGFLLVGLILAFSAVSFILGLFPATASLVGPVVATALRVVNKAAHSIISYLPNLMVLLLVFLVTHVIIRIARALARALDAGLLTIAGFHREWATPTYALVRILLILFALVVAFPYLPGGDSPVLKGASIFVGVLVSLGSGSAMGNVIAGVILTYMRPFRVGDRVKIADTVGDVVEKSLLVTRVRTIKNVEVIVPNSAVLGAHISNYSANAREQGLILNTTVTIGYDVPWPKVHELLIAAALKTSRIIPEPKPFVFQTSLNDYHVSYEINAFTGDANRMADTYSELHRNIQAEFNSGGVEIMSPSYLSLRDGNTVTIPENQRPRDYVPGGFRVNTPPAE